jgi:hypothetical protein
MTLSIDIYSDANDDDKVCYRQHDKDRKTILQ